MVKVLTSIIVNMLWLNLAIVTTGLLRRGLVTYIAKLTLKAYVMLTSRNEVHDVHIVRIYVANICFLYF